MQLKEAVAKVAAAIEAEAVKVQAAVDATKMAAAAVEEEATINAMEVEAERAAKTAEVPEKTAAMAPVPEDIKSDVRLISICDGHGQVRHATRAELWAMVKV